MQDGRFRSLPGQLNGATLRVVPEPGAALLLGLGLVALARLARSSG